MEKYINLLKYFIKYCIIRDMNFRFNFFINILTDFTYSILKIIFTYIIFENVSNLGGLTKYQIFFLLGTSFILDSLYMMFLFFNHTQIPESVRMGTLDFTFIKPVSPLFMVSFRYFNIAGIGNLIFGGFLLLSSLRHITVSVSDFLIYILLLICGFIIYFSISLTAFTFSFWTVKADGFLGMLVDMTEIMKYPHSLFPRLIQSVFTFIIPIFMIASYPTSIALGLLPKYVIALNVLLAILCFTISTRFFKYSLLKYTSAN